MPKRKNLLAPVVLALLTCALWPAKGAAAHSPSVTGLRPVALFLNAVDDREQDGLVGPVRRVRTETAKLTVKEGKFVEGPRKVLETATYDIKGGKIDNQYFLQAGGSLTGREVYKYDDKGNITEMALFHADGTLLSKEVYSYEFDAVGNWTKMTTSVAVLEGGRVTYEPSEVTYRMIAYYLDEGTLAKLTQAAPVAATAKPATPAASAPANPSPAPAQPAGATQVKTVSATKTDAAVVPASLATAARPAPSVSQPEIAALDRTKLAAAPAAPGVSAPVVKDDGEDAPPRLAVRAPVKPISGGVLNGKAVKLPPPVYPLHARHARVTGTVAVEVVIDLTGKVISATATGGPELLHKAAEQAAMQARFSPTTLSGQPVKISGVINYNFAFVQ